MTGSAATRILQATCVPRISTGSGLKSQSLPALQQIRMHKEWEFRTEEGIPLALLTERRHPRLFPAGARGASASPLRPAQRDIRDRIGVAPDNIRNVWIGSGGPTPGHEQRKEDLRGSQPGHA
jgi:hypothetical protein